MSTATLIDERLEKAKSLLLLSGGHPAPNDPDKPEACFLEMEAWIYGEDWSDAPPCVSPVLRRFGIRLNDRLSDEERQKLKRFQGRLGGTAGDGQDPARIELALRYVVNTGLPDWLELVGLPERAAELRSLEVAKWTRELRDLLWAVRDEVWKANPQPRRRLREAIEAEVRKRMKASGRPVAAAVAAAVADAVAAAVAAAVAVAVAAAVAAAVAVAVADAVADAVAAAVADAVADAVAAADRGYETVYRAVRNSPEVKAAIDNAVPLVASHREQVFELFEKMIDPKAAA